MPSSSITMNMKFVVVPLVIPGGSTNSFKSSIGAPASPPASPATPAVTVPAAATSGMAWTGISGGISVPKILGDDTMKKISGMIKGLQSATNVLLKIVKLVEVVMSSFGSLSAIVQTVLNVVQVQVNKWLTDLSGVGVYFNMIIPPAFQEENLNKIRLNRLASGGFQNFISTLGASFYNTADKNRPVFSKGAQVGGFIILIDSDSLDQFIGTMATFTKMFSFVPDMKPTPPSNVKGVLKYDKSKKKYGVLLKWDAPPIFTPQYLVYRSMQPGGRPEMHNVDLTTLKLYQSSDDMDLFKAVRFFFMTVDAKGKHLSLLDRLRHPAQVRHLYKWPQVKVRVYDDLEGQDDQIPDFNGPQMVAFNPLTGGGSYADYNIKIDDNGKPVPFIYYYVVKGGMGSPSIGSWSAFSGEAPVRVSPACLPSEYAAVTTHMTPDGKRYRGYISSGWSGFGKWESVRLVIPFLGDFTKVISDVLKSIAGMTSNATSTFSAFIQSIKDKIDHYAAMVEALVNILIALQSLQLSGRVAYLFLPMKAGGVSEFMSRVKGATPLTWYDKIKKQEVTGFSGPSGITAGMVFLTGIPSFDSFSTSTTAGASLDAYKQTVALKNQTFEAITKIFMSIFGGGK